MGNARGLVENPRPDILKPVTFSRAIVRIPGQSFTNGLTASAALGSPEIGLALAQHSAYCEALRRCGLEVTVLPPDERFPDGTFVEDTAVVAQRVAVATRPGAPTRTGEVEIVAAALRQFRPALEQIRAPGTVDGGDVCQAEDHFLIGVSARTNEAGARQLAEILARHDYSAALIDIRAHRSLLHLKSGISYLGDGRMSVAADVADLDALASYEKVVVDAAEEYAANCVRVNDAVLVAAGFPRLAARLDQLGYAVRPLDVSEFRKMDGGLSCLSIRF
jgi:dimethylargininase